MVVGHNVLSLGLDTAASQNILSITLLHAPGAPATRARMVTAQRKRWKSERKLQAPSSTALRPSQL